MTTETFEHPIIYLEDEILIALDMQAQLEDLGLADVRHFGELEEAFEALDQTEFQAAILDFNLKAGATSHAFGRTLKDRDIPVLYLTGLAASDLPEDIDREAVLAKPAQATQIIAALKEMGVFEQHPN